MKWAVRVRARAARLKAEITAISLAMADPRTPLAAKIIAGITVAYALSPIDLIPDFIPFLGFLDDLILLPAMIAVAVRLIPEEVLSECRERAAVERAVVRRIGFAAAIVIVAIWAGTAGLLIRGLFT